MATRASHICAANHPARDLFKGGSSAGSAAALQDSRPLFSATFPVRSCKLGALPTPGRKPLIVAAQSRGAANPTAGPLFFSSLLCCACQEKSSLCRAVIQRLRRLHRFRKQERVRLSVETVVVDIDGKPTGGKLVTDLRQDVMRTKRTHIVISEQLAEQIHRVVGKPPGFPAIPHRSSSSAQPGRLSLPGCPEQIL